MTKCQSYMTIGLLFMVLANQHVGNTFLTAGLLVASTLNMVCAVLNWND